MLLDTEDMNFNDENVDVGVGAGVDDASMGFKC